VAIRQVFVGFLGACFALVASVPGHASNRRDWDQLTEQMKVGYVAGAYDGELITNTGDAYGASDADALIACLTVRPLTLPDMVQMVSDGYSSDPNRLEWPAAAVLSVQLSRRCHAEINMERVRRHLTVLPPGLPR